MAFETIAGTDLQYGLISFDGDGNERPEPSGLMSQMVISRIAADPVTNVFFFCHGWQSDIPAAKDQYNRWIGAFMRSEDREKASQFFPNFKPLLVGLHWPSLPWGDEEVSGAAFSVLGRVTGPEALLQAYLDRLGDRPEIRRPLNVVINEARRNAAPDQLPPHVYQAYLDLNDALGLGSDGVAAPPDADRESFDPQVSFDRLNEEQQQVYGSDVNLGGLLGPLRQLSYWTMKKRARTVGEGAMHRFLKELEEITAAHNTRIHLMGHSFGTIIASGMLGGPAARGMVPRPVDSVVLVQGAVSLWSYASEIPFRNAGRGYYNRILQDNKIRGPLVTTRSKFDDAVGVLYPLASRISGSASFAGALPEFGAMGAYGIQGIADDHRIDATMVETAGRYVFEREKVYNLDGSRFICHKQGVSGAHSDITGPEVAHTIWSAAFASV